ncbi:MAG: enoyl-CoA hydratase/isomerase family protein [Tepidiformaceae bacterium]
MEYEQIVYEERPPVAIIRLNRPERMNAHTSTMDREQRDAVMRAEANPEIGAIVFTGTGRAYMAGADVGGFADRINDGAKPLESDRTNWTQFLEGIETPTICAVNGVAVGMGVSTMLPMDIRIASEEARFGLFFVKMGVVPELGSSYYLPQLVGLGRAKEWCLTTRLVPAKEACEAGLVTEVVPADRLLDRAIELGTIIAKQPPPSVRFTKQLFRENATNSDVTAAMRREGELLNEAFATWEHKEAVSAFLEKREPNFRAQPVA